MDGRVVVTGMGVIAPGGVGVRAFWQTLVEGRSPIDRVTSFDVFTYPVQIAGQVRDEELSMVLDLQGHHRLTRFAQFAVVASRMAVDDAQIDEGKLQSHKTGIFMGTSAGPLAVFEQQALIFHERGLRRMHPLAATMVTPHVAASHVSIQLGIRGPALTVSTGCPAGIDAVACAVNELRKGTIDVALAGGVDTPISPIILVGLSLCKTLSARNHDPQRASRPFDQERDGFVLAEGAGVVVLERLEDALHRGARIYGEIGGYGSACDAYDMLFADPDGSGFLVAMMNALSDAQVAQEEVDYISAHAPSVVSTDAAETRAIKRLWGERAYRIPVSSIKSCFGQALGAGSAHQLVAGLLTLHHQLIPPTINYEYPDPECDLDYVPNVARQARVETILINTHGFGGNNSTLIVRQWES